MIGTSFWEYVFIRACVFILHKFVPLLLLCLVLTLVLDHDAHSLILFLEAISIAEVAFYVLVYIPKYRLLQRPARHPPVTNREDRRRIFLKGQESIVDPEQYLFKWFNEASISDIRRENVKEFYCWAFLNRRVWGLADEEELDEYVDKTEELLGRKLPPGRGPVTALRLTIDPVNMLHRPLLWYMIVSIVDTFTYLYMTFYGFRFYRLRLSRFLTVFPFRFVTLSSFRVSNSSTISYWYRPHTSRTRKPILFIHGIGIGLYPYVSFLSEINRAQTDPSDGQVGVIAIELMPISFRMTGEMPDQGTLCQEIIGILDRHGWDKVVLMSHSYGTVVTTNLLRGHANRIGSIVLADPVTFLLQQPDVAYNFTRRPPRKANEHQLYYFASTDMCVAHTLARHFFWIQNIMWKEDIKDRNVTVILSGKDLIVNTHAVGQYLTEDERGYERFLTEDESGQDEEENWRDRNWKGEGLDVLWFDHCDHAQVFDKQRDYKRLVDIVRSYSAETDST